MLIDADYIAALSLTNSDKDFNLKSEITINKNSWSISDICPEIISRSDNDKERIKLTVEARLTDSQYFYAWKPLTYFQVRPYNRVLGTWFRARRTISCAIDIRIYIDKTPTDNVWNADKECLYNYTNDGELGYEIVFFNFFGEDAAFDNTSGVRVFYSAWAKQPNTPKAYVNCTDL